MSVWYLPIGDFCKVSQVCNVRVVVQNSFYSFRYWSCFNMIVECFLKLIFGAKWRFDHDMHNNICLLLDMYLVLISLFELLLIILSSLYNRVLAVYFYLSLNTFTPSLLFTVLSTLSYLDCLLSNIVFIRPPNMMIYLSTMDLCLVSVWIDTTINVILL